MEKLNNGLEIPSCGIGTFMIKPVDVENSVEVALKNGYRLIYTTKPNVDNQI